MKRVLIVGAAGRDFHNFNVAFRDDPTAEVVAFTAGQLPNIAGRRYPAGLAGSRYPDGIPIEPEEDLARLVRDLRVDTVVFSYSDVTHDQLMHLGSEAMAAGADYLLLGPNRTMVSSRLPVIAVCAARTGSGKSQTTRCVARLLRERGIEPAIIRHPMPYGDLAKQRVQRFSTYDDLELHETTIEEREEYEPLIEAGFAVYAGVDYEAILHEAENEGDVILWDGGNNDLPFYVPDVLIAVYDALRPEDGLHYHPGETVVRMADAVVLNKVDSASLDQIQTARDAVRRLNPAATVIEAASPITVDGPIDLAGRKVLVVEDGPTITHGGLPFGAGWVAARRFGAAEIVDPRGYAVGSIVATYDAFPAVGPVLPAMGYGKQQVAELAETIRRTPADVVVVATPIDLRRLLGGTKPSVRVRYELQDIGSPSLRDVLKGVSVPAPVLG